MQEAQVQSLVGKLRSHMPYSVAKKIFFHLKKKNRNPSSSFQKSSKAAFPKPIPATDTSPVTSLILQKKKKKKKKKKKISESAFCIKLADRSTAREEFLSGRKLRELVVR